MGGAVPSSTASQTFQAYTPNKLDWANYKLAKEKQALQMAYYKPMLEDMLARRDLYKGVMKNDPESLRQFVGLPAGASPEQVNALVQRSQGVSTNIPKQIQPKAVAQTAAKGGIMQLRGFAPGGTTGNKGLDDTQAAFVKQMAKKMQSKKALTDAEKARLDKIEKSTGRDVSPYSATGTIVPSNPDIANAANAIRQEYSDPNPQNPASQYYNKTVPPEVLNPNQTPSEGTGKQAPITEAGSLGGITPGVSPKLDPNKNPDWTQMPDFTNPWVNASLDYLNNMQAPSEWNQASGYYNTAAQGLQGLANYQAQNVAAQQASAERASAERASAAQMAAIADVRASQMQRPEDISLEAQRLQRYQMDNTAPVTTQDLIAYQMEGPGSWTDEGVSSKYMSPYMQGVIDISKREAERDYQKQQNALNAKALSAGAFGGARQALERSEAQRNYNQQLQDMQVKGLQQAYESGRSQYGQELNLSQQAALNNLQSKLSTQSQSSQQALQAMLSNQNIDYQTKVQNLQAMLGVQSQEAQQMLNAALANQQMAFGTSQTNAQLAQQAALANQQTQFGVGSLNANLANQVNLQNANLGTQAAMQNAQLGTQTSWQNAQNALNASIANQQAGLQANQQNIGAYNAMGNMAQGLGAIGNNRAGYNQQYLTNLGTAAGLTQDLWNQGYNNNVNYNKQGVGTANPTPNAAIS